MSRNRLRATVAWAAFVLGAPGTIPDAGAATRCDLYAAPVEADGGRVPAGQPFALPETLGTRAAPFAVADFWKRKFAMPGKVLCLMDGEYRGRQSMIEPPLDLFAGKPGARIEIRALNDGRVWIDGEFRHRVLRLRGHHYWTITGLNLFNSTGPVVGISGTKRDEGDRDGTKDQVPIHDVVVKRVVAWRDYIPYGSEADYDLVGGDNVKTIGINAAEDVLLEDVAAFGWARKIIASYRSQRVTFRRTWARWDGRWPYAGGNKFAYTCSYKTYDAVCENVLATAGGSFNPQAYPADYDPPVSLIATDGSAKQRDRWVRPIERDRNDIGLRITGSLAYLVPGTRIVRVAGLRVGGARYPNIGKKNVQIDDTVSAIPPTGLEPANLFDCDDDPTEHPEGCSWNVGRDRKRAPLRLASVTLSGGGDAARKSGRKRASRIHKDWQRDGVVELPWRPPVDIYSGKSGASLCTRTVGGRKTTLPLWPWPMQERIRAASERSNWPTADVMGDITALFGEPPARCRLPEKAPVDAVAKLASP